MSASDLGQRLAQRWSSPRRQKPVLVWQPPPPITGNAATGRQLATGLLRFCGHVAERSDAAPWDALPADLIWAAGVHGHEWLDDLAAAGEWETARSWTWAWLDRFAATQGPEWEPHLTARRLMRWLACSAQLLNGQPADRSQQFFAAVEAHTATLSRKMRGVPPGHDRVEAAAGLLYAMLSLEGAARDVPDTAALLGETAAEAIGSDGSTRCRNGDNLVRIVHLLRWAGNTLEAAGHTPSPAQDGALQRAGSAIACLLRGGGIGRFHGGGEADLGPLAPDLPGAAPNSVMGYQRMEAEAAVLLIDCGPTPDGPHRATAHASALALEICTEAQPLVVNCGSGAAFGSRTGDVSRRTAAHSGIEIAGMCAATLLDDAAPGTGRSLLCPGEVTGRVTRDVEGLWLLGESAVYEPVTGLRVERRLNLAPGGERIAGEDTLLARSAAARNAFSSAFSGGKTDFAIRFHLAPGVDARLALGGRAVSLRRAGLREWLFRSDGHIELRPSQYFDTRRAVPRATCQIVVSGEVIEYWGRASWTFERLSGT